MLRTAIDKNRLRCARQTLAYERKQLTQLKRTDGTVTRTTQEAAQAAVEYCFELYTSRRGRFVFTVGDPLGRSIAAEDLREACRYIHSNAAPGVHGISLGVAKHLIPMKAEDLTAEINRLFEKNDFPDSLIQTNVILLHKSGDTLDLDSY